MRESWSVNLAGIETKSWMESCNSKDLLHSVYVTEIGYGVHSTVELNLY